MDPDLLERAGQPDLRIGRGILAAELAALTDRYVLVSQPEPLAWLEPSVAGQAFVLRPAQLGLDRSTLSEVLMDLPRLVREAGLPHSILDETEPDRDTVDRLLDPILVLTATDHH
jgi:hypothetical protein